MARLGEHAVVIGASMGGLLAARALADCYDRVTIIERDALPELREPRKGVPQGRHAHGLLARGREVLDQLFPGFSDELVAEGALHGDVVDDVLWYNHGCYLSNAPSGLMGLLASRPMIEDRVRRKLRFRRSMLRSAARVARGRVWASLNGERRKQMTKIVLGALLAVAVATSANAGFSVSPLTTAPGVTRVAEGCGPGMWRGPHGRCHPMFNGRACPRGYHLGPNHRRCWPN